jgi:hypothetical protein
MDWATGMGRDGLELETRRERRSRYRHRRAAPSNCPTRDVVEELT